MRIIGRPARGIRQAGLFRAALVMAVSANLTAAAAHSAVLQRGLEAGDSMSDRQRIANLAIPFVFNSGQADANVAYYAQTLSGTIFVTHAGEIVYTLPPHVDTAAAAVAETFVDARPLRPVPGSASAAHVSSFIGTDRSRWRTNAPTYDEIGFGEVYSGIAVHLKAYGRQVEKIFTVQPGASADRIRVHIAGAQELRLVDDGTLALRIGVDEIHLTRPYAFQQWNGQRHSVEVAYTRDGDTYGFHVGAYDHAYPLIIDPLLQATYAATSGDSVNSLAVNPNNGDVYITGQTLSTSFPGTAGAAQGSKSAGYDGYVIRLDAALSTILQATYLGGSGTDIPSAIAFDTGSGNILLGGDTSSSNFPGTEGSAQAAYSGDGGDAFIAQLNGSLTTLLRATYVGGYHATISDHLRGLAINSISGDIYASGYAPAVLPANGAQSVYGGGNYDSFVIRLNSALTAMLRSTYLGGSNLDIATDLAIDSSNGDILVAGHTSSTNFPGVAGSAQSAFAGGAFDLYVARLNSALTTLVRSTYLGGSGSDIDVKLAINTASGEVYVGASTASATFPGTNGGAQSTNAGDSGSFYNDAIVARLNGSLTTLLQATYFGGSRLDNAVGLAVNSASGAVYLTGNTTSFSLPATTGAAQPDYSGQRDSFLARFNANLTAMQSTYFGGSENDGGKALAINPTTGDIYLAGFTASAGLPATNGGAQSSGGIYVARLNGDLGPVAGWTATPTKTATPTATSIIGTPLPTPTAGCSEPSFELAAPWGFGVGNFPHSVAVADFNGDGRADLAVAAAGPGVVSVLLGVGDGTFGTATNFPVGSWPVSVATGDFNGDAKLDLVTANYSSDSISILLGNGTGGFGAAINSSVGAGPDFVAVGDFNNNGKLDLAVARRSSNGVSILLGNGNGTFGAATTVAGINDVYAVVARDFNNDGKLDLVTADASDNRVWSLSGNGLGGFAVGPQYSFNSPTAITVGYFDMDSTLDLALTTSSGLVTSRGFGDGSFSGVGSAAVTGDVITTADWNLDGKLDLAIGNYGAGVSLLLGDGNAAFYPSTTLTAGRGPSSLAAADFNLDGRPDFVVTNENDATVSVFLNRCGFPPLAGAFTPTKAGTDTSTPTATTTPTFTTTPTVTNTSTPTNTSIQTATATPSVTPMNTSTGTPTATAPPTSTTTPSLTSTTTPTQTSTATQTATFTRTPTATRTATSAPTITETPTPTRTPRTPTATSTVTASLTRTPTAVPSATPAKQCVAGALFNSCVPGGGPTTTDCNLEFNVRPVPRFDLRGIPRNRLDCYEGDSCDAEPDLAAHSCTFLLRLCINNVDERFPTCFPSGLQSAIVLRPRWNSPAAADQVNLALLEDQLNNAATGFGITLARGNGEIIAGTTASTTNLCSAPLPIVVPLRQIQSGRWVAGRGSIKVRAVTAMGKLDTDTLVLRCLPSTCGNGLIELSHESCDDANRINGDGCDQACRIE